MFNKTEKIIRRKGKASTSTANHTQIRFAICTILQS